MRQCCVFQSNIKEQRNTSRKLGKEGICTEAAETTHQPTARHESSSVMEQTSKRRLLSWWREKKRQPENIGHEKTLRTSEKMLGALRQQILENIMIKLLLSYY